MFADFRADFSRAYCRPSIPEAVCPDDLLNFHGKQGYDATTQAEFSRNEAPKTPVYSYKSAPSTVEEQKTEGVFFAFLRKLAMKIILPASLSSVVFLTYNKLSNLFSSKTTATVLREDALNEEDHGLEGATVDSILEPQQPASSWKYKRISIDVNGTLIDAMIVVKETTAQNGRWMIQTQGNCELYERAISPESLKGGYLEKLQSNGVFFNYQGVGGSQGGTPTPEEMVHAYKAVMKFVEEKLGAKEIIGHGFSIGGGIQGQALKDFVPKEGVKYAFIAEKTFSKLSKVAESIFKPLGMAVRKLDCEINGDSISDEALKKTVVVQTGNRESFELDDTDDVIPKEASLAHALEDKNYNTLIYTQAGHNVCDSSDIKKTCTAVEKILKPVVTSSDPNKLSRRAVQSRQPPSP